MKVVDCPHCITRVMPSSDGTCPSCGKNTSDLSGTTPGLAQFTFDATQKLPSVCAICGEPGTTTRPLVLKAPLGSSNPAATTGLFFIFGWLVLFFHVVIRPFLRRKMTIALPLCAAHSGGPLPVPSAADLDAKQVRIVVHKELKEAYSRGVRA